MPRLKKLAVQQYSPANPPLGVPNLIPLLVERECSAVKIKQHGKRRAIPVASFPLAVLCYRLPKAASSLRSALSVLGSPFPASPEYTHPTRSRPRGPRPRPPPSPTRAPVREREGRVPGGARSSAASYGIPKYATASGSAPVGSDATRRRRGPT
ncbi:hypothetical protein THAOC_33322 [Thalassiosira oceanica]|uniref:Uncharacterized protein n=1 Tax=Thalassiosira oceanica TaxID=159749 RepID=K0R797_THAOC|nr:hypothetical protein THAOC_33322 [Thalassiosira oceanica]|eukprot:EJK47924.1 hypothetical protein THAOC_33322 [Thalassiosira oceanica]